MSKVRHPDNFKIEVVNHYRMYHDVVKTVEKYGIARSTVFKWKKQYEENRFSKTRQKKTELLRPQARAHKKKVEEIMQVRKECGCPITASIDDKMKAIQELEGKYSARVLCEALLLPRGTYNYRKKLKKNISSYELADAEIKPIIEKIFYDSGERFGRNPIKYKLLELGYLVNKDRISRLMKEMGLKVKKAEFTYEHQKSIPRHKYPNILKKNFSPEAPNIAWASDITYVKVGNHYMFICVVLDLFSRKVISYGMSDTIDTVLVMNTFEEAFNERGKPQNLIFHSDQGVQYTSFAFRSYLKDLQVKQSFSMPGHPYDNSVCESFFHTLKKESLYRQLYADSAELSEVLDEYIEFYNEQRLHRTLKMKTPSRFETEFYSKLNV